MAEKQESAAEAFADAIGCLIFPLLMIAVFVGIFMLRVEQVKQIAKDLKHDMTTPAGHLTGRVKTVETWKAENFTEKQGDMTLTLDITDRTRITFEDGRSKELLGMPKDAVPKDKDVVVVWAKYDLLLEIVDAEEYKKREKEKKEKEKEVNDL
jgi:hypothetical protein